MLDTRREVARLWGQLEFSSPRALAKILAVALAAFLLAILPEWHGLSDGGRWTFFILLLAGGLWVTEAIPSFAVAILIIGLEILILGHPGGVYAEGPKDWEIFVQPWASPIMWLFLGGFVLGQAAQTTGIDRIFARYVLQWFGTRPGSILLGAMSITFIFSMFMSNTATTAMMMSVMAPLVASMDKRDPTAKAILLGVPFAANVGGMGTIIGSPPNAIAAGLLAETAQIDFLRWMLAGFPPALLLLVIAWIFLQRNYRGQTEMIDIRGLDWETRTGAQLPMWKRLLVLPVFLITVLLWMTGPVHHMPTAVVSFIPITLFAITGILRVNEIRSLQWDVLLLLAGGLSLGVAIRETGLAVWLVNLLPAERLGAMAMAFVLAYATTILSNFMSNTAATNILAPIAMALAAGFEAAVVIPLALGASSAMCLPISTPPNAIAYASGRLESRDFLKGGILLGTLGPALAVLWLWWLLG